LGIFRRRQARVHEKDMELICLCEYDLFRLGREIRQFL
jgi:hypothetical protein